VSTPLTNGDKAATEAEAEEEEDDYTPIEMTPELEQKLMEQTLELIINRIKIGVEEEGKNWADASKEYI